MKKVINGKMYNTETANLIKRISEGTYGNWDYADEELYRKRNGEFFICFTGRTQSACMVCSTERTLLPHINDTYFYPITRDFARTWAEENLDGNEYESIFGEIEE